MLVIPLKFFILAHFMFTSWALAFPWLPTSYLFSHLMILMFAIWVVIQPDSLDAAQVFLISLLFGIVNDCVLIGIYFDSTLNDISSERKFAVVFSFFNLFLKPVTIIFFLLGYQERGGTFDYSKITQAFTSSQGPRHEDYQNIPETAPTHQPSVY